MKPMRVLLITKLFPSAALPDEAPFNRNQFAALSRFCDVEVLATIPWFPGAARFSRWPIGAAAPREEVIEGLRVRHPRYLYVPRVAPGLNGPLYAASLLPELTRRRPAPDILVGAFAYPDGYAAVRLGQMLGVPTVVKVHGSDIDVLSKRRSLREPLCWGLGRASRVVAVSRRLADGVEALGVPRERIDVIMNGIDGRLFRPQDRAEARRRLGRDPDKRLLLFVGHLLRDKGIFDLLEAFEALLDKHPDLELAVVGSGAEEQACRAAAERLGGRVSVLGSRPHKEVAMWMAACDVLVLPSHHEGTPNVVIEALASGRRVVATTVGGIPDLVRHPDLGELVAPGDRAALARALSRAAYQTYDPAQVVARAELGDWDESARRLYEVLAGVVRGARGRAADEERWAAAEAPETKRADTRSTHWMN